MDKPRRYTTLEAMRGIGAIYVVLLHGEALFGRAAPQSAYLGVDFFFVLSGFVMAHVYAAKLDAGLPRAAFLGQRLLRLYPVYLLGALSGVAFAARSLLAGGSDALWNYVQPVTSLPFALLLLPSPASDALFPLDIPAWSLFMEFVVNIGFTVPLLRRRGVLALVMAVAGAVLAGTALGGGTLNAGWDKPTALLGLARICFSFPLGVLTYAVHRRVHLPSWLFPLPLLGMAGLVFIDPAGPARIAFDLVFLAVLSPALVLAGAACSPSSERLNQVFVWLGAMSYPLYTLHYPALMAALGAISRHVPAGLPAMAAGVAVLVAMVLGAGWLAGVDARFRAAVLRYVRTGGTQPTARVQAR